MNPLRTFCAVTITAASGALFALVLSLNLLGDSLRRAFDPKAA